MDQGSRHQGGPNVGPGIYRFSAHDSGDAERSELDRLRVWSNTGSSPLTDYIDRGAAGDQRGGGSMSVIIGSARIGENGHATGGKAGDQKQKKTPDYSGEVSMQEFYIHPKGWNIIRPKSAKIANAEAEAMKRICNNPNIGYDQNGRYGVVNQGSRTKTKTEADCSSSVRECVKEASGKDPGDFTTANAVQVLESTGLFEPVKAYKSGMTLYTGDILCTKTKGHIVIVVDGAERIEKKPEKKTATKKTKKKGYTGSLPVLPPRGYYQQGDGYKTLEGYKQQIKKLQSFLNWAIGTKLKTDGQYGPKTEAAVVRFQQKVGIKIDGSWGRQTANAARNFKK